MKPNLIIGLGNPLLGDDGIGCHVVDRLAADPALLRDTDVLWGGTDLLRYAGQMKGRRRVIFVDAMLDGPEPGSISVFEDPLLELEDSRQHAHHLSLVQAIELLRIASPSLRAVRFTLIAIGVESANIGTELSPPLAAQMLETLQFVRQELS